MADQQNRRRAMSMRELTALQLKVAGFEEATPRLVQRRLSERISEDWFGDVLGVDGWLISTRADLQANYGPSVDAARQAAALRGVERSVVIQYRDRVPASEFLAVLTLRDWADLAIELQGVRS